ncbi:hypothetical protein [Escherichia coli]|uniref:hypothetical protein n=1 Tax=Escherichia coli TaxID=562 RepID=UPI00358DA606
MPKYLLPAELAEIVCGLLVQPALLNELKTPATHKAFMQDIGELVAKHCGGQIDGVIMPEVRDEDSQADYLTSPDETPYIVPRFYVSTSKSIIKALINIRSFKIQLSPIG